MKTTTLTTGANRASVSVLVGKYLNWAFVAKCLNRIPFEIAPCKSEKEAKEYVGAMAVILSGFIIASIY